MADRRAMSTGIAKIAGLTMLFGVMAVVLASCGSADETTTTTARPAVTRATADRLVKLSDRIASDLDAGDTCNAAHAADGLQAAVADSDLPANLRPGVDAVAVDLVNQVNCPAPPPPPPPPEPEKKPKPEPKPKNDEEQDHGQGNEHGQGENPGHSKQGGFVPPGEAQLKGQEG
jgi:hypothetical protein